MSEPLKPCPFCKCPAMFIGGGTRRFEKQPVHVECSSKLCSARTSEAQSQEQAAKIWNTRRWDEFGYQAAPQPSHVNQQLLEALKNVTVHLIAAHSLL